MPSNFTLRGSIFNNAGKATSSAQAKAFVGGTTTTALSNTVTNAKGIWQISSSSFADYDAGKVNVDVQLTNVATGAVGRVIDGDRTMQEAVYVRELILSPDSNDATDANKGFFTTLLASSSQGSSHTVTFPKLTGSPLITATKQSSDGAITLSDAESIVTAGDITMSSGTLTVDGNFTVSSAGVVTSSGQISAGSSLHVTQGGLNVGGGNFTVSSLGVVTSSGQISAGSSLHITQGGLDVGGGNFTVSSLGVITSSAINASGLGTFGAGVTISSGALTMSGGGALSDSARAVTAHSVTSTSLVVSGTSSLASLAVTGGSTFSGAITSSAITASGTLTANGVVDIQGGYANGGGAPYDGVVDAGGGGNWTTAQAGDDDLDAGSYTMLIKAGTYSTLTVSTNDAKIVVEPGTTFTGAITLSGTNIKMEVGSGSDLQALVTISGSDCSFICENGVTMLNMSVTGNDNHVDGGGWGTIVNGATTSHAIVVGGPRNLIENIQAKTTGGSGNNYSGISVTSTGDYSTARNVYIPDADGHGINTLTSGHHFRVFDCYIVNPDGACVNLTSRNCRVMNNQLVGGTYGIYAGGSDADETIMIGNVIANPSVDEWVIGVASENCLVVANRTSGAGTDHSGTSTVASNEETSPIG